MIIRFQPAAYIDMLTDDGHTGTKLPYPIVADEKGMVQGQEFWKGDPNRVIGFQKDLARHEIDLWWHDAVKDPSATVGMYLVTDNTAGDMGVHQTAIESATVYGQPDPEETPAP
jgi:hypothetical protein